MWLCTLLLCGFNTMPGFKALAGHVEMRFLMWSQEHCREEQTLCCRAGSIPGLTILERKFVECFLEIPWL